MRLSPVFLRKAFVFLLAPVLFGQNTLTVDPANTSSGLGWATRPYKARVIQPARLTNSPRLNSLIQAGILYLSARDMVALAIENNIDVEVQRYTPLLAREVLRRAESGGALRSVGLPVAAGPQSVSLQGVAANTAGGVPVSGGGGISSGGGI